MLSTPEDRAGRITSLREITKTAWREAMLKKLSLADPSLAERIAMQDIPRMTELLSSREALHAERDRLEARIKALQEQQLQDPEEHRTVLFSISTFRQHLSTVNRSLGELAEREPGAQLRERLESQRSEACRCLGVGGTGQIIVVIGDVPIMETICPACDDGIRLRERVEAAEKRLEEEEDRLNYERKQSERADRARGIIERSGVPDIYGGGFRTVLSLPARTTPEFRKIVNDARQRYGRIQGPPYPKGLYLYGPAGHGKTSLLAAIARTCAASGIPVMFTTVLNLLDSMRAGYGRKDGSSDTLLERAKNVPVLILDDLGMQQGTDHERARLLAIISTRHGKGQRILTCFSSNYTRLRTAQMIAGGPQAVEEEVQRIEGRLREMTDEVYLENIDLRIPEHRQTTEQE